MTTIDFVHRQSAHCESGVTANLLSHHGIPMTEPLAFGIGGGLFFCYIPLVKMTGMPMISFRYLPGAIFKGVTKALGIEVLQRQYRDRDQAMRDLQATLDAGQPVGMQTGAYWLPFFPEAYRVHFNAHNLIAYGYAEHTFQISDPCLNEPVTCDWRSLMKARFSQGALAPKGRMYYPLSVPDRVDLPQAVQKGIERTCFNMLRIPFRYFGCKGIRHLSKLVRNWPRKAGDEKAALYLAHLVRMQEEIGTGGGAFRFLFGAFLQEAERILEKPELRPLSLEIIAIGDAWRVFASQASRICKGRPGPGEDYDALADLLMELAGREKAFFEKLRATVRHGGA